MAKTTRKSKESSEINDEKASKKQKVERNKKNIEDDEEEEAIDMTEVARERHAEWAKLVLGKIDPKSPGNRLHNASEPLPIEDNKTHTKANTIVESIAPASKRGKGKGALITNLNEAKNALSTDNTPIPVSKSKAKGSTESILLSKKDNQNSSSATTSTRVKTKSTSPTRTPTTKAIGKQYKETPAAPKMNTSEGNNKSAANLGIDVKMVAGRSWRLKSRGRTGETGANE